MTPQMKDLAAYNNQCSDLFFVTMTFKFLCSKMAGRLLEFCQYSSIVFGMESMLCPYGACNTHHNTSRELFRHCYLTHWQWQIRPFLCDFCFKGFYQK